MNNFTPHSEDSPKEWSVWELSSFLKKKLEDDLGDVRVCGEISSLKRAASGHIYMNLKDDRAVIDAVCWKGVASSLRIEPQDGFQVVVTGSLTVYPERSKYQLMIKKMEYVGDGMLRQLLEKRRKALADEGLFDSIHKKVLPFLPRLIGVITSLSGAVLHDIQHRLRERCPSHMIVYPVPVQGKDSAQRVAEALAFFNTRTPKPDIVIVARGGGSLEDLWAFNEEVVVRAAYASQIPVISAIGHETDVTLLDLVADVRAPTPTAAAEIAVPVITDIVHSLFQYQIQMQLLIQQHLKSMLHALEALPFQDAEDLFFHYERFLDDSDTTFYRLMDYKISLSFQSIRNFSFVSFYLIEKKEQQLESIAYRLTQHLMSFFQIHHSNLENIALSLPLKMNILYTLKKELYEDELAQASSFMIRDNAFNAGYGIISAAGKQIVSIKDLKKTTTLTLWLRDGQISGTFTPADSASYKKQKASDDQQPLLF